ncbi:hypothetical protein HN011_012454 [Eciton burchellii]|nr:hypothetical protein HN011_012454 [Eciton burchellii]
MIKQLFPFSERIAGVNCLFFLIRECEYTRSGSVFSVSIYGFMEICFWIRIIHLDLKWVDHKSILNFLLCDHGQSHRNVRKAEEETEHPAMQDEATVNNGFVAASPFTGIED